MPPTKRTKGGEVRIVDSSKFKVSTTAMAHGHGSSRRTAGIALAPERGRVAVLHLRQRTNDGGGDRQQGRTMDFQAGDVGYVQKTLLHYIENTGDTDLVFLEMFKSDRYSGPFVFGVAGSHAAGIGHGASEASIGQRSMRFPRMAA